MAVYSHISLKPDERIVRVFRRFPLVNVWHYLSAAIFLLLPFFFLFPLLKLGWWGIVILVGVFLVGLVILIRTLFFWFHNVFVVTTERVFDFDQRGFFERVVSQSSYEKIQDISFHIHGVFPTMFRYGDLNIKSAWGSVDLHVPAIFNPHAAQELLLDLQEQFLIRTEGSAGSPAKRSYGNEETVE